MYLIKTRRVQQQESVISCHYLSESMPFLPFLDVTDLKATYCDYVEALYFVVKRLDIALKIVEEQKH